MSSSTNSNLAPPASSAGTAANLGRRGSYAAVAAAAAAAAASSAPSSATQSTHTSPATKRVDPILPSSGANSKPASQPSTPQQAPPLVPAAIIDPNSRQAKWAAHEAQRRASLSAQGAPASGTHPARNRSRNRSRDRSKSPHHSSNRRPNGGRASVSNVNDEVVAMAGGARSVSPPSGAGSTHSNSPPHQYTAPQPPSPTSASALGMAWNNNGNPGTGHNRARRGSATSLTSGTYAGEFVDRTSGASPVPEGTSAAAIMAAQAQAHAQAQGRRPSGYLSAHAAELMNIAARKMASKEEERAAALAGLPHASGGSGSGGSEPGEIVDADTQGEEYDQFHTANPAAGLKGRSRSKSISSYDPIQGRMREFQAPEDPGDLAAIWGRVQATHRASISGPGPSPNDPHLHHPGPQGYPPMPPMPHQHPSMSVPGSAAASGPGSPAAQMNMMPHRRSSTFSYATGPWGPGGEQSPPSGTGAYPGSVPPHMHPSQQQQQQQMPYTSLPSSPDRIDRLRASQRRFSVSPTMSTGDYDQVAAQVTRRPMPVDHMSPRRHSVAGAYQPPGRRLSDALASLSLEPNDGPGPGGYNNLMHELDEYYGHTEEAIQAGLLPPGGAGGPGGNSHGRRASTSHAHGAMGSGSAGSPSSSFSEVGRGIPLHVLPSNTILYIVEFKAGRSDIYYFADETGANSVINKGDLVIVEADRGKDLGKVINNSITPHQIHLLQAQQSEALSDLHRVNREIHPKRIYRMAQPQEVQMLMTKMQDEAKALAVCQTKVRQKKLPMNVVDAEYQWDRRKLTFYFIADRRIDFRELVRDLFKIYKTRIWMCAVSAIQKAPYNMGAHTGMPPQHHPQAASGSAGASPQSAHGHLSPTYGAGYPGSGAGGAYGQQAHSPTSSGSPQGPQPSTLGFVGHPGYQSYQGFPQQHHGGSAASSPVREHM